MIWSAKSSTEGTGSSGQIAAAPNCKNSCESSRRETMWIISFSACNIFSRYQNQPNYQKMQSSQPITDLMPWGTDMVNAEVVE